MSCEIMHTLFTQKNNTGLSSDFLIVQILHRRPKGHVKFMRSLYAHRLCSIFYLLLDLIFQSSPLKPLVNSNQTCLDLSLSCPLSKLIQIAHPLPKMASVTKNRNIVRFESQIV